MSASWVSAIVAIVVMLGTAATVIWRAGRFEGRTTAILEQLASIAADHEDRIRAGERHRAHHRRGA